MFAIPVERVETADSKLKKLQPTVVLTVENVRRILEVWPMVVESVLKDSMPILENMPIPVLKELTASWVTEKLLPMVVDSVDCPRTIVLPRLLRVNTIDDIS